MATEAEKAEYRSKMAFVVGYTGETGKELIKELLQRKVFQKVLLIGRRQVQLDGDLYKDVEQKVVDFDNLDQDKAAFDGCSVGFCCLGTTRGKSGKAGFVKVDHDYVVNVAKVAYGQGCQQFSVVSSGGANKDSWFLYMKTKGQMEHDVTEIGFPRFTIFHPGFIVCDRQEQRIGERIAGIVMKPLIWTMPTVGSVPANSIAKAMIADLFRKTGNKVDIIENQQIHQLAKELKD